MTRTYSDLFNLIQALCGVVFANIERPRIVSLINRRVQKAYRSSKFWPKYLVVGEKTLMFEDNVPRNEFNQLMLVKGNQYYIASYYDGDDLIPAGASSNSQGVIFTSIWDGPYGVVSNLYGKVNKVNISDNNIDTVIKIHRVEPYLLQSAQEFDFYIANNYVNLISAPLNPDYVWLTYQSMLDVPYGDNDSEIIDNEWFEYIAHGVYADYLRSEGQQDKAQIADQEADLILQDELIRLDEQRTTGLIGTRISTNANWQTRY